jgi:thiamine kinase-like enzyme
LWEDRFVLLDVLERLPQTFCHLDAWRRNLYASPQVEGQHQLIAIDWAYPGLGTIATAIGDLFAASFSLFGVEPCDLRTLDTT